MVVGEGKRRGREGAPHLGHRAREGKREEGRGWWGVRE